MKSYFVALIFILIGSLSILCQANKSKLKECSANPDHLYNRQKILGQIVETLNNLSPEFRDYEKNGFYIEKERPRLFFVFDLSEPSNNTKDLNDCIKFKDKHIYHIAPVYIPFSFSQIAFLEDGSLKIFKAINCKNSEDNLEKVIAFLNQKLKDNKKRRKIISRVKNYRKFGIYFTIDDRQLKCENINN